MHEPSTVNPYNAVESLRAALAVADIVLPSLGVDPAYRDPRLVELGRIRPEVAARLAEAIGRGCPDDH